MRSRAAALCAQSERARAGPRSPPRDAGVCEATRSWRGRPDRSGQAVRASGQARVALRRYVHQSLSSGDRQAALEVIAARGLLGIARAQRLLRPAAHLAGTARRGARAGARERQSSLSRCAEAGQALMFLEPSCLSAIREDAPDLLRGDDRRRARVVASRSRLFEDWLEDEWRAGRGHLAFRTGPARDRRPRSLSSEGDGRSRFRRKRCSPGFPARQSSIPMPVVAAWRGRSAT